MRSLALALAALAACAHADVGLRNAGTVVGPVTSIDCGADAGVFCARATGTSIGKLSCAAASATNTGCVTPHDQVFAGRKTIDGGLVVMGATTLSGATVSGDLVVDGGTYVTGPLMVDGGVTISSGVTAIQVTSRNGTYIGARGADGGLPNLTMYGTNVASMNTTGLAFASGVSVAQGAPMSGYSPGGLGTGAFRKTINGGRKLWPGQLSRLSGTVATVGNGDGGLAADGGATQQWFLEVYNDTAGVSLCVSSLKACDLPAAGMFGISCGIAADGGGTWEAQDDVVLAIHDVDCLRAPGVNVEAGYVGLQ